MAGMKGRSGGARKGAGRKKNSKNDAGKIIGTVKVQLAYHQLRGEVPTIPFLAGTTKVTKP